MNSTVTDAELYKNFGAYQDAALREPLIVTENGRPRIVLVAYEEYRRLSKRDQRAQLTVDLTEAEIAEVQSSCMAPGAERFDAEVDAKDVAG